MNAAKCNDLIGTGNLFNLPHDCSHIPVALSLLAASVRLSADFLSAMMTTAPGTLGLRPAAGLRRYCVVNVTASPAEGDR